MTRAWEEIGAPLWDAPIAAAIRHHHPLHAAAMQATGKRVRYWMLRDGDGGLAGTAQIGLRRWPGWGDFAILGRGPLWAKGLDDDARREALLGLLAQLKRGHRGVLAAPDPIGGTDPLGTGPWLEVVTPICHAVWDLDAPPEVLRAGLKQKWRNRLYQAEAAGLEVRHVPWDPEVGRWVLQEEARQRRLHRYSGAADAYTLGWAAAGGPASTRLFTARMKGITVAAMLFLLHPPGASYHIGWTSPVGRQHGAHTLLLWRAAIWLSTHGYPSLDLDVIDTETEPGIARFKLGTGASLHRLSAMRLWAPGTGLVRRLTRSGEGIAA